MLNFLIIISTITVFSALFILKTKSVGEWSLLAFSYGLFLLFVLYWRSGNGRLDGISITLLFLSAFCNSFHQVMGKFCWDFIFQLANGGVKKITWKQASIGSFQHIIGITNIKLISKNLFEDIARFELQMINPVIVSWYYLLDFDCDIEVFSGEVKITYKNKNAIILKTGDFIIIRKKEIHKLETVTDTVFKFNCRK